VTDVLYMSSFVVFLLVSGSFIYCLASLTGPVSDAKQYMKEPEASKNTTKLDIEHIKRK